MLIKQRAQRKVKEHRAEVEEPPFNVGYEELNNLILNPYTMSKITHFVNRHTNKILRSNNGDFLPVIAKGDIVVLGIETREENTVTHYTVDHIEHQLMQKGTGIMFRTEVVTRIYLTRKP